MDANIEKVELSPLARAAVISEPRTNGMKQGTSHCIANHASSVHYSETAVSGQEKEQSAPVSRKFRVVTSVLLGLCITVTLILFFVIVAKSEEIKCMKNTMESQQMSFSAKYNSEIEKLKATIKTQYLNFTIQISDMKTLNGVIGSQQSNLTARASEIKILKNIIESQQLNLTSQTSDRKSLKDIIERQKANLTASASEIRTLQNITESQQSNIAAQASEIQTLNKIIKSHQSNLTSQASKIKTLKKIIESQNSKLAAQASGEGFDFDINKFGSSTDKCHANATYTCTCKDGFQGNGYNCSDTNECRNVSACSHIAYSVCNNSFGSYTCECAEGYEKNEEKNSCIDIDECASGDPCSSMPITNSVCDNAQGGFCCNCMSSLSTACRAQRCYMNFNKIIYWFVLRGRGTTTKRMAQDDCTEGGGSLAIFHSIDHMHRVHEYLRNQGFTGGNRVWTGMKTKSGESEVYILSDKTNVTMARGRKHFTDIATGNAHQYPSLLLQPQDAPLYGSFCETDKTMQ